MKIASWNLLSSAYMPRDRYPTLPEHLWDSTTRYRSLIRTIADLMIDQQVSVLSLQEVDEELYAMLRKRFVTPWRQPEWHVHWEPRGGKRKDGLAIISRGYKPQSIARLTSRSGQMFALIAEMVKNDETFVLANAHLSFDPGIVTENSRSVKQIKKILDFTDNDSRPIIITGDLNDPPGGLVRKTLVDHDFAEVQGDSPSACIDGESLSLDVISTRGFGVDWYDYPIRLGNEVLTEQCPSDHSPVAAAVRQHRNWFPKEPFLVPGPLFR